MISIQAFLSIVTEKFMHFASISAQPVVKTVSAMQKESSHHEELEKLAVYRRGLSPVCLKMAPFYEVSDFCVLP